MLPIETHLQKILTAVKNHNRVILTATPGAGKSTHLPPDLLKVVSGKIAVLEPRRIAALGAALRVADQRKWQLGNEVGYQVRHESRVSESTRLIFMTDALLLRRMLHDPELKKIDMVIIDEFHERNTYQDLILGLIKELQDMGSSIKLLVMSATLNTEKLLKFLPDAVSIDVAGSIFPLEIQYSDKSTLIKSDQELLDRTTQIISSLARQNRSGLLCFLPGVREIRRVSEQLRDLGLSLPVFELHGSLDLADQKQVLAAPEGPRIVLATNIAEASLTVPGTDTVIDSGLAKSTAIDLQTGFSRLELIRISHFNSHQRAGRAAREKAGLCIRMWSRFDEANMKEQISPEVERTDLSSALLFLARLGIRDFAAFSWLDQPPQPLLHFALEFLRKNKLLKGDNTISDLGAATLEHPIDPRLGLMVEEGRSRGAQLESAWLASLLSDSEKNRMRGDVIEELREALSSAYKKEKLARSAAQILKTKDLLLKQPDLLSTEKVQALKEALLFSHRDRIARRRRSQHQLTDRAVMTGGRGLKIPKDADTGDQEFLAVIEAIDFPGEADSTIQRATTFDKEFILRHLREEVKSESETTFDIKTFELMEQKKRTLLGLDLEEPQIRKLGPQEFLKQAPLALVSNFEILTVRNESVRRFFRRLRLLKENGIQIRWSKEQTETAVHSACSQHSSCPPLLTYDWTRDLHSALSYEDQKVVATQVPEKFTAPTGNQFTIFYPEEEKAFVEVRVQELFGLKTHPKLAGSVPLLMKLLAPNYRPAQITSDIVGFWQTSYAEVKKQLKSRYPKHAWPDDPAHAAPVAKGRSSIK